MIQIWGKKDCVFCESAKSFLDNRKIDYDYLELDRDFSREEILQHFPGAKSFPQIVINGQKVGGHNEMTKYIEETGYTGTGYTL